MRIGKLTQDGYSNYGNVLQNYALQKVLNDYGDVDSLWHSSDNFFVQNWYKYDLKTFVKFLLNWNNIRTLTLSDYHGMEMVRQGKIKDWCDRHINVVNVTGRLSDIKNDYDFFVVGSDQVWNPYYAGLEDCFLTFAPPQKRISYAASISCSEVPSKLINLYKKSFDEFAHISMREQQGVDMVKSLSGRDVPMVVDPTMLLSPDEWRKVSRPPAWYHGGDYILTYFLGKRPKVLVDLEQETGVKVVNLLDKDIYEHYVMGPDEFIWVIEHAKLLYTDSFHGTVFSILFRTPFVVCNRIGSEIEEKMGSRIDTLLDYFGLESRRGTEDNDYLIDNPLMEPDWSKVDVVLAREHARADDYLKKALNIV